MGNAITHAIKRMARTVGVDIRRLPPWREYGWLGAHDIRTVLDVGANTGQFATLIRRVLPDAMIYSFEPLTDCYTQLVECMKNRGPFRAFNIALGDANGTVKIYRNEFSPSSSLLPMEDLHRQAFPFTQNIQSEDIEVRRLDDIVTDLQITDNLLAKIDVQGFEDRVLLGGQKVLAQAAVLVVETSFQSLYQGQPLFDRVYRLLCDLGFTFTGSEHNITNPRDGTVLQSDCVFIRRGR